MADAQWILIKDAPYNAVTSLVGDAVSGAIYIGYLWLSPKGDLEQYIFDKLIVKRVTNLTHWLNPGALPTGDPHD